MGVDKRILCRGQVLTHGEETQAVGSRVGRRGGGGSGADIHICENIRI